MTQPSPEPSAAFVPRRLRLRSLLPWALPALALIGIAVVLFAARVHRERLAYRLLAAPPAVAGEDPALVRFATAMARPLFARHCAACHGADMRGTTALGAPDLTDATWLYGSGSVYDIERTLLYGIRSGRSKARNITEMPAYGLQGRLDDAQVESLVQYLLKINRRPYQAGAANQGQELFYGPPDCGDCHGPDARGNTDYGAPDLTIGVWNNGGDPQSLYASIYNGRHRIMPAWFGVLSLTQIRALAVYLYSVSHPSAATRAAAPAPALAPAGAPAPVATATADAP